MSTVPEKSEKGNWNANVSGVCPRCEGKGCKYCDSLGSLEGFEAAERKRRSPLGAMVYDMATTINRTLAAPAQKTLKEYKRHIGTFFIYADETRTRKTVSLWTESESGNMAMLLPLDVVQSIMDAARTAYPEKFCIRCKVHVADEGRYCGGCDDLRTDLRLDEQRDATDEGVDGE